MKKNAWNNRSGGFTVVELLAVVAIMVILMGIAMVGVFRYRDLLKITELDNAAREIYMAAENRAVLLSGSRRLSNQIKDAGDEGRTVTLDDGSEGIYASKDQVKNGSLLTPGSVDPALWDSEGDFYIIYQPASGSVVGVFYAESPMKDLVNDNFPAFYEKWAKDRSERLKLKDEMLVGYYNGQAGEGAELVNPDEASVRVMIKNEEKLTVTVECTLPDPGMAANATLRVELGKADGSGYVDLETKFLSAGGPRYSFTWVLDSLEAGKQFKDLKSNVTPGDDFSVRATVSTKDNSFVPATRTATDNSLFEKGSGGGTAGIKYLRHLQNLDANFSGVKGKKQAVQTGDEILCTGNGTYGDYDFVPISNLELTSYNGNEKLIRGLYVSGKKSGHAGLFAEAADGMRLENIRLVNASVAAGTDYDAGALVGHANGGSTFQNCQVYWEPGEDKNNYPITGKNAGGLVGYAGGKTTVTDCQVHWEVPGTDLIDELGSDVNGSDQYKYQIIGTNAGGLAGYVQGNCTITRSLAAVLAKGTSCAGGLAGVLESGTATVRTSYADCYLKGGEKAAGLFGDLKAVAAADLADCYAAGYIMGGTAGAGLCAGAGSTTTTNVYSVMIYPDRSTGASFSYLTQKQGSDSFTNTYFLGVGEIGGAKGLSYEIMTDNKPDGFAQTMGGAFAWKNTDSHPYNLREHLTLTLYSYPGLKDLPHYGDWNAQFKEPSLVYYEEYNHAGSAADKEKAEENWGVSGGNARDLIIDLAQSNEDLDGKTVTSDGYGVAFLRSDYKSGNAVITYYDESGNQLRKQTVTPAKFIPTKWANDDGSAKGEYYLIPLPKDMIDQAEAEPNFYRYLKFDLQLEGSGPISGAYYFNPHFADTVKPIAEGVTLENLLDKLNVVLIRTPRHLKDLSKFKAYYHDQKRTYRQALSLDYTTYDSYGISATSAASYVQKPIGGPGSANDSDDNSFSGVYDGDCNTIKGVIFTQTSVSDDALLYEGLFGYSQGTLRNIVYEMNPEEPVSTSRKGMSNSAYVGALVGGNKGAVRNCAVSGVNLTVQTSGTMVYAGGLVGLNDGRIEDCAAECANLAVSGTSYAKLRAGGLVGSNEGSRSISTSYAVGRVRAEVDNTVPEAEVCGFAGRNAGVISYSYAAADLQVSGGNADLYGFCGSVKGSQVKNAYMDQGNFSYRDAAYAAKYERDGTKPGEVKDVAVSTSYQDMIAAGKAGELNMATVWSGSAPDPKTQFPYPTGVTDKNGKPCHYGEYPKMMPLGQMGVFYWEKMVDASDGKSNPSYHLSALAVDPDERTIVKQSTLSQAHNDGRVVTEYGYGYYFDKTKINKLDIGQSNIIYRVYSDGNNSWRQITSADTINQKSTVQYASVPLAGSEGAAVALQSQAEEKYNFYCWTSYHEGGRLSWVNGEKQNGYRKEGTTQGLSLFGDTENGKQQGGGIFRLNAGYLNLEFGMTPMFADSLSINTKPSGWTIDPDLQEAPGTKDNPFQIRCGAQLQQINWMKNAWTDTCVGQSEVNDFPYLSSSNTTGKYVWEQTHDVDWVAEGNICKWPNVTEQTGVFMGIAQARVTDGKLTGWFGGTYDGQNYTIKNLKIGKNGGEIWNTPGKQDNMDNGAYDPNCMGLFGAVQNATLRNIVLYAESGENNVVNVLGRKKDDKGDAWYAGGVLVGLARTDVDGKGQPLGSITNCAVAGYTIRDETHYARTSGDMGGAIGGLVGMTNMNLTGCTASTTIVVNCDHSGGGRNSPVRIGGLVGSTTAGVENCYTGGSISSTDKAKDAYICAGRVIGGVGTEPVAKETEATVRNCYSYLNLPKTDSVVKEIYRIGGRGRTNGTGKVNLTNNYYLNSSGASGDGDGTSVSYRQLSGKDPIEGDTYILEKLNGSKDAKTPYDWVTTHIGTLPVKGRYSFAPTSRQDLQGLDYPFPTVLKMEDYGAPRNVHYGAWTISGILRDKGGEPIELDMFTEKSVTEQLKLSEGLEDGAWDAKSESDAVTVGIDAGKLTITGVKETDPVDVTVTYTKGGVSYDLTIQVYVRAEVSLTPETARIFPNDTFTLSPTGHDKNGGTGGMLEIQKVEGTVEPISAAVPEDDSSKLRLSWVVPKDDNSTPGGGRPADRLWLTVTYNYTDNGYTKENASHNLELELLELPTPAWDDEGKTWTIDFGAFGPTALDVETVPEGFTKQVKDGRIILTKLDDIVVPVKGIEVPVTLTMDGVNHELTVTMLPKEGTLAAAEAAPAAEAVPVPEERAVPAEETVLEDGPVPGEEPVPEGEPQRKEEDESEP